MPERQSLTIQLEPEVLDVIDQIAAEHYPKLSREEMAAHLLADHTLVFRELASNPRYWESRRERS